MTDTASSGSSPDIVTRTGLCGWGTTSWLPGTQASRLSRSALTSNKIVIFKLQFKPIKLKFCISRSRSKCKSTFVDNEIKLVTFFSYQISLILKHEKFIPLSSPGGDGRNDIALLYIRHGG